MHVYAVQSVYDAEVFKLGPVNRGQGNPMKLSTTISFIFRSKKSNEFEQKHRDLFV